MDVQADDGAGDPAPGKGPPQRRRRWALLGLLLVLSIALSLAWSVSLSPNAPSDESTSEVPATVTVTLLGREGPLRSTALVLHYLRSGEGGHPVRAQMRTDGEGRLAMEPLIRSAYVDVDGYARTRLLDEQGERAVALDGATSPDGLKLADARPLKLAVVTTTGSSVPSAKVTITLGPDADGHPDMPPWTAQTNERGEVTLAHLPRAPLDLRIVAEGFAASSAALAEADELVRVTLDRTGQLVGRVEDAAGSPVRGAVVRLVGSDVWPPIETESDGDGLYRFEGLGSGVYELRAVRKPMQAGAPFLVSAPTAGVFLAPLQSKTVNLTLIEGQTLRGHVRALGSRAGIEGAKLTLTEAGLSFWPHTAQTDAEGRFVFEGLLPTAHSLGVDHERYVPVRGASVAPGTMLEIFLERGGVVEGMVVDERGFPIEGATLELLSQGTLAPPQVYVRDRDDATGLSKVAGSSSDNAPPTTVPAQLTSVTAQADGTTSRSPQEARATGPGELGVTLGQVPLVPVAHTTYVPGWSIAGEQTDQPTLVSLSATEADLTTDRAGHFRLERVPAGTHVLQVAHEDYGAALSAPFEVIASRATDDVSVTLTRGYTLDGRVVDARGYGVSHAQVRVHSETERFPRVLITESDGTFLSRGLSGTLQVEIRRTEGPLLKQVVVPDEKTANPARLERIFRLDERVGELNLRVVDSKGFPVEGALIRLEAKNPKTPEARTLFSAADGRVQAGGLPAGAFQVRITKPGFAETEVTLEDSPRPKDVALAVATAVVGELVTREGEAAGSAIVQLAREDGPSYTAQANSDGHYEFPAVALGAYRVTLTGHAFVGDSTEVVVEAPPPSRDAFELPRLTVERAAAAEGVVMDSLGTLVPGAKVVFGGDTAGRDRASAVTDARGHFRVQGLARGHSTLSATHPTAGDAPPLEVTLQAGETAAGLTLRLEGQLDVATASTTATASDTPRAPSAAAMTGVAIALADRAGRIQITAVAQGSAAQKAGLLPGDVIRAVEGEEVLIAAQARSFLRGPAGTRCTLRIERKGREKQVAVERETHAPL